MTFIEWMDLGSAIARLLALLASPVAFASCVIHWRKGNKQDALIMLVLSTYLNVLGTN